MGQHIRASIPRPPVYRITLVQLAALSVSLVVLWVFCPAALTGIAAGALIEIAARAYFGFYAYRHIGARQMSRVVSAIRRGELGKFILVAALFAGIFLLDAAINPVLVFSGYLAAWALGSLLSFRMLN